MTDNHPINQPDPCIAAYHSYWQRNRQIVAGARAVKPAAQNYLTREHGMDDAAFRNYVKRVPFYPAATRTHDGLIGLMLRSAPTITCPDNLRDVLDTITTQGFSVEDLSEDLASERLITNYTALVTDYPVAPPGLSLAQAIDQGYRPFVAMYRAESILGIETATIGNRQRVCRVRLLDDCDTVRELRLDAGVYSITLHRNVDGQWRADKPIIPTRAGKPLDEIPFTLDSTSRDFLPVNAPLGDLCELNVDHYIASANLATEQYYSTVRIFVTGGLANDVAATLPAYSGARWNFEQTGVEREILSASDNVISDLRETCHSIERHMATVGLRMLEADAASNVAAETVRIRDNAQNASLAALVRRGDRSLNDQLKWVAYWLGYDEDGTITYETPTDFGAVPMQAADIAQRMAMWQSGAISLDTFLSMMVTADVLPETFDAELDRQKIGEEIADRPTTEL